MLKAKIDATCYPIVKVESSERLAVPNLALHVMQFDPMYTSNVLYRHGFLLYFQEVEE